jgi:shikimate dehydrogenase
MQLAALQATGMQGEYLARSEDATGFGRLVDAMRRGEWSGGNVTVPYKVAAREQSDWVSPLVRRVGAANTLVRIREGVGALNTDVDGIAATLEGHGLDATHVVLLGAGGAARAVVEVLSAQSRRLTVVNRTLSRAAELCAERAADPGSMVESWQALPSTPQPAWREALEEALQSATLVIDAAHAGLEAAGDAWSQLPWAAVDPRAELFDLGYGRAAGGVARRLGRTSYVDGATMLLHQGAAAFEAWHARSAPLEPMRAALAAHLGRRATGIPLVPGAIGRFEQHAAMPARRG